MSLGIAATAADSMRCAARLGAWAAGLTFEDVPAPNMAMATRAIIDAVGVAHAGAAMPVARALREVIAGEAANGPCHIIGLDRRLQPAAAALLNAASAHALDFDANFSIGMVFAPATFAPGLLALAEREHRSGREVLTAFCAASEVARVLAETVSPQPYAKATDGLYRGGWFNTSVFGPIAAAAGASRMLGLSAERTATAMACAATQAGGLRIAVGSDMKVILCAQAAERGVRAALLAQAGLEAPLDAFEGSRGLVDVVVRGAWRDATLDTLGDFADPGLSLKRYPACSSIQAAGEALERIIATHALARDEIIAVTCDITGHIAANLTFERPENTTQAQFSMPFALACLLVHGRFTAAMLSMETIRDPAIAAAMQKVSMRPTADLDTPDIRRDTPEATRVTVRLQDGRSFSHLQLSATGRPGNPMPDAMLDEKFLANAGARLTEQAARGLLARLRDLSRLPDMAMLFHHPETIDA